MGRYYAMDRDKHWDRTEICYKTLTNPVSVSAEKIEIIINNHYQQGLVDEYIRPTAFGNNSINSGDSVIFFNYREDSIRQIFEPFVNPDFKNFKTAVLNNIFIATMTKYSDRFLTEVLYPSEKIINPLGKVIADHQKKQLRIAETEKYAHVTYFFNGLQDAPLANEYRLLVPSQTIAHHEDHPEMMAVEITNRTIQAIEDGQMDFILVNYANADVIAHTANYEAAIKAVKIINEEMGRLIKTVLNQENVFLLITADHGNIEQMLNPTTGLPEAKHNASPVPIYLVAKELEKEKSATEANRLEREPVGILADVAPTVLALMEIPKPTEMTGENLLEKMILK
jgi:2,3-bisphosphoglycerate-independent phosphoglycerate mutase